MFSYCLSVTVRIFTLPHSGTFASILRIYRSEISLLPITSGGNFARVAGFAVSLEGAGTRTTGIVRCDQPRALDLKARHGKRLEQLPTAFMDEVLAKLAPIFE